MKIFEIVFSPTGGTEKVAKIVANELNKKVITLNMLKRNSTLDKNQLTKDDVRLFPFRHMVEGSHLWYLKDFL